MSHKGLVTIIILVSVVTIGVYASTVLPTQSTSPLSIFMKSIQQDIVLETIHATDEVALKKDISLKIMGTQEEGERGRVDLNHNKTIVLESTSDVSDGLQVTETDNKTSTTSHHKVVINDGMSSTTPP
jgi:hypothetical protein